MNIIVTCGNQLQRNLLFVIDILLLYFTILVLYLAELYKSNRALLHAEGRNDAESRGSAQEYSCGTLLANSILSDKAIPFYSCTSTIYIGDFENITF